MCATTCLTFLTSNFIIHKIEGNSNDYRWGACEEKISAAWKVAKEESTRAFGESASQVSASLAVAQVPQAEP